MVQSVLPCQAADRVTFYAVHRVSTGATGGTQLRRIRTGVVGFGLAGRVFHAPFVQAVPALELVAIVQRTGDSAKEAYPQAVQMRSYDELLASDVELVVLGTPTPVHFAMTKQALEAGKHVVCDKPMTLTSAQAEEVEALAAKEGVLLFPFHNRRFDGDFKTMRTLIESGKLGRIVSLDTRFDRYRPDPKPGAWREEEEGGGLLYDIGPHLIDQVLTLFGTPFRLWANLRSDRDRGTVPDGVDIHMFFHGPEGRDVLVRLGMTTLTADPAARYRLHGTRGSYVKHGLDPQELALVGGAHVPPVGSATPWLPEPEAMWGTLTIAPDPAVPAKLERSPLQTIPGDYRDYYTNVAAAILGEVEPAVTPRAAVRTARVIELAAESSRTGCSIAIDAAGW
jgi:scyllo-inositol 2-dehydrogenase (NADP+)